MGKDPATLWYWADWNGGTSAMSRSHKGAYMDLLYAQFNTGHLSLDEIKVILNSDFDCAWNVLQKKFIVDENGLYYNEKADNEKQKRSAFTESRRKNLLGKDAHTDSHMASHMVNVNVNANKDVVLDLTGDFETIWITYPNRQGKKQALRHFLSTVKTQEDVHSILTALANYLKCDRVKNGYIQNGSTWFNDWQSWINPSDTMMKGSNGSNTNTPKKTDATTRATFRHTDEQLKSLESFGESLRQRDRERSERSGPNK